MPEFAQIIIALFLVIGAIFAFIGSLGLAKLDDFYMRLHGPTKATTLGLGGILIASSIYFSLTRQTLSLHELLITVFLFITAPVSAHMLAKTALLREFQYRGDQDNPLDHPLNIHSQHNEGVTTDDHFE